MNNMNLFAIVVLQAAFHFHSVMSDITWASETAINKNSDPALFEGNAHWNECPAGYVIGGFYKGECQMMHCIEEMKCVAPKINPVVGQTCYDYDIGIAFDSSATVACDDGYFVRGIYSHINNAHDCGTHCWETLRCCKYDENVLTASSSVDSQNWWHCFDADNLWCSVDNNEFITGFFKTANTQLYSLETASVRTLDFAYHAVTSSAISWAATQDIGGGQLFEGSAKWYECPNGYVVAGFYRNFCQKAYCIEYMKCATPWADPVPAQSCYDKDIQVAFDNEGTVECDAGYMVRGIYGDDNSNLGCGLNCWSKLRCCRYSDPLVIASSAQQQTQDQNWWHCFDGTTAQWCTVDSNEYVTGFFRSAGSNHDLYLLEAAKVSTLHYAYIVHVPASSSNCNKYLNTGAVDLAEDNILASISLSTYMEIEFDIDINALCYSASTSWGEPSICGVFEIGDGADLWQRYPYMAIANPDIGDSENFWITRFNPGLQDWNYPNVDFDEETFGTAAFQLTAVGQHHVYIAVEPGKYTVTIDYLTYSLSYGRDWIVPSGSFPVGASPSGGRSADGTLSNICIRGSESALYGSGVVAPSGKGYWNDGVFFEKTIRGDYHANVAIAALVMIVLVVLNILCLAYRCCCRSQSNNYTLAKSVPDSESESEC